MSTFFIRLLKFFLILVSLCFVGMLGVFFFVDPSQFKGVIEKQVLAKTGQILTIQGPITWQWSPKLSLAIEEATLKNSSAFEGDLASAKKINADIDLASFVSGKVLVNLSLVDLNLNLIKDATGKNNWQNLINSVDTQEKRTKNEVTDTQLSSNTNRAHYLFVSETTVNENPLPSENSLPEKSERSKMPLEVQVNNITLNNASIQYVDQVNHKEYNIKHLTLHNAEIMDALAGEYKPLNLNLDFSQDQQTTAHSLAMRLEWTLRRVSDEFAVKDLEITLDLPEKQRITVNGDFNIQSLSTTSRIEGMLESNNLDIKGILKSFNIVFPGAEGIPADIQLKTNFLFANPQLRLNNLTLDFSNQGHFEGNFIINLAKLSPATLTLTGDFEGTSLQYQKILLKNLQGKIESKNGIIQVNPLDITLAGGTHHLSLEGDLTGTMPKFTFKGNATNLDLDKLLSAFEIPSKITGESDYQVKLSASGNDSISLKKSLQGQSYVNIKNGKFYGADLVKLLKTAQSTVYSLADSVAKKKITELSSLQGNISSVKAEAIGEKISTPFNSLQANFSITNGLIKNPDLLISHEEYQIKGAGEINLNNTQIDYKTAASLNKNQFSPEDKLGQYLYQTAVPIKISGSLTDLKITPDLDAYWQGTFDFVKKNLIAQTVEKNVNNFVGKIIENNKVGKELKDKINEQVGDKLQKAIGGFLKN